MSTVEDIRKGLQDFLVPELRSVAARLENLEKIIDLRFKNVETMLNHCFQSVEQRLQFLNEGLDLKFASEDSKLDAALSKQDVKLTTIDSKLPHLTELLELDRRLKKLEAQQPAA